MSKALGCQVVLGLSVAACLTGAASAAETEALSQVLASPDSATVAVEPNPHIFDGVQRPHLLPWRDPAAPAATGTVGSAATGPQAARSSSKTLTYYGGPVLSNVNVVKVNYGSGTYQPFVSGTGAGTMDAFFQGVLGSAYLGWLNGDYKTPTQTIGYGSYGGDFSVVPSAANNGATINDTQIQAELVAQINNRQLPAPTANTLYTIFFPKGKKIQQGTSYSCQSGGFCAYHGTIKSTSAPGGYIQYAVLPDNSAGSGCDVGCGTSTAYNNWCSVTSHETTEAITDPAVGVATTYASPLGWYNKTYGEIGDLCNGQQTTVKGTDGVTYTVQKEWSNSLNACKATFP